MRCILFCQNNYAFGILELIRKYLENNEHDYIWYVNEKITNEFTGNANEEIWILYLHIYINTERVSNHV
mgnify:CR=1 FL=1